MKTEYKVHYLQHIDDRAVFACLMRGTIRFFATPRVAFQLKPLLVEKLNRSVFVGHTFYRNVYDKVTHNKKGSFEGLRSNWKNKSEDCDTASCHT